MDARSVFGFISLIVCFSGYCLFIKRIRNIAFAFTPAITSSLIILALFVGGIFGILSETTWILYLLGNVLAISEILRLIIGKREIQWNKREVIQVGLWILGAGFLFAYLMRDKQFLFNYDDFSHWGVVAKLLIKTNRFPLAADSNVIQFRSYPVGAAAFIYFCCKLLQESHSSAIFFAQAFAVFNFYFSLFGCIKTDKMLYLVEHIACSAVVLVLTFFNIRLNFLQVDNLVSANMLACMMLAFVCNEKNEIGKRCLELGLISGAGVTVKTSGLLLIVFLLFVAEQIYEIYSEKVEMYQKEELRCRILEVENSLQKPKRDILPYILLIGIPLAVFILWKAHVFVTFSLQGVSGGKHSGSLSSLAATMGSGKERFEKLRIILPHFFNTERNRAIIPLICIILLPAVKIFRADDMRDALRKNQKSVSVAVMTALFYFVYEISLLMMYMFSMSLPEMVHQNGSDYYRYNNTIVSVVVGILFFMGVSECESRKSCPPLSWLYAGVCVLGIAFGVNFRINWIASHNSLVKKYPDLYLMEEIMETDTIMADDNVLVRYHQKYGVPTDGAKYYLYPCESYTVVFEKKAYESAMKSNSYTVMIDLVNGSVQNREGKRTIAEYLQEN